MTYDRTAAVEHLRSVDPKLATLIDAAGEFDVRPERVVDPYPYLLRSIVFQQLNGTAAATIHGRVLDLFGGEVPPPEQLLAADVQLLRGAGLSGSKAASVQDLARHAAAGELPTSDEVGTLSDLELVDRLTAVRGIGPWTVHMLLMFRLGRPDVLPTGDFGVREGWRMLHGREAQPTPAQFRDAAEHWRPYRSVASWYMWRCVDLHRSGTPIVLP
ncbi:MAG: DNA-3-methyladenine glycosylase 2 family protein [Thermoleophilia bacterium]|nr:DNA-3-methyladenine glycosylase 2 family protein [Thermoleophilia bacterium]